jgi:hypothetical protein
MKALWRKGKLGAVGLSAAAIAMAAMPEESQSSRDARRAGDPLRQRPAAVATASAQLDMARLRRLQSTNGQEPVRSADAAESDPERIVEANPPGAGIVDAFATRTWYVPPPPPPPVALAPPPKPVAPPLPFSYMGRYDEPEKPTVIMLVKGDRLYTVAVGDSIDGTYRVERVEDGVVEMTYLPLQEKQQLATGNPG